MTDLVVEDGTGLADADSYASIETADSYHARMGNTAWAPLDDDTKSVALRRATQYIDNTYTFLGEIKNFNAPQALQWPRTNVIYNGVYQVWPVTRVVQACCELAFRAAQNGSLVIDADDAQLVEATVGPISVRYGESQAGQQTRYTLVDRMLNPLTGGENSGNGCVRLDIA